MKKLAFVSFLFVCLLLLVKSFFLSESTIVEEPIVAKQKGVKSSPLLKQKPKLTLIESFDFTAQHVEELPNGLGESSMGKSYRELLEINVAGRKNITINFEDTIEDVISVVIAGRSGKLLPSSIKINNGSEKSRYEGQELFEDDWIKIDDFKGKLNSINLDLIAKESGSLKIYIQKHKTE